MIQVTDNLSVEFCVHLTFLRFASFVSSVACVVACNRLERFMLGIFGVVCPVVA